MSPDKSSSTGRDRFTLPQNARAYRKIGPFTPATLPAGLTRQHQLKPGAWGRLTVLSGAVSFIWDSADEPGLPFTLQKDDSIIIAPAMPHHLVQNDQDFLLEIEFHTFAAD